MLDFLEDSQWPGRRVREGTSFPDQGPESSQAAEENNSDYEPARLVPREEAARVRGRLDNTRRNLADLREEARRRLKETLHLPAGSERPQLQNAVNYLSGHHQEFGDARPSIPNSHKIGAGDISSSRLQELLEEAQGADGQIDPAAVPEEARRLIEEGLEDGQLSRPEETPPTEVTERVYRRALDVLEHGDRIALGFDSRQVASTEFDGTVEVYGSITSPAEAAGEVSPPVRPERKSIDAAVDERMFMTKREIFLMVFYAVMYSILYWLADTIKGLADSLNIEIGVGPVTVDLTWPITAPLYMLARLCRKAGRYFERLAMGMMPDIPDEPDEAEERRTNIADNVLGTGNGILGTGLFASGEDEGGRPGAFTDGTPLDSEEGRERIQELLNELQRQNGPSDWDLNSDRYEGSAGLVFLMSAVQVDQAVRSAAEDRGSEELGNALRTYLQSRESDQLYNVHRDLASEFGVQTSDLELEDAGRLRETEPLEVELEGPPDRRDYIVNPDTRRQQASEEEAQAATSAPRQQSIASDEDDQPFEC